MRSLFNQLAVLAGVFVWLIVQILLTMLGFGIGLLAIDVPTASSAPAGADWAALLWGAVGGLVSCDRRRSGGIGAAPGFGQQHRKHPSYAASARQRETVGAAVRTPTQA
jgi:hypothetical protein